MSAIRVEQAIARGETDEQIAAALGTSLDIVKSTRAVMDRLVAVDDVFTLPKQPQCQPWAECGRGHPLTPDNIYRYPSGKRECRICKLDRARASYRRTGSETRRRKRGAA